MRGLTEGATAWLEPQPERGLGEGRHPGNPEAWWRGLWGALQRAHGGAPHLPPIVQPV